MLFTILTLGIYSAWAKVRSKRYFYGNTELAGDHFDYLASPIAVLKGRLIAVDRLLEAGLPPMLLVDILRKLEAHHLARGADNSADGGDTGRGAGADNRENPISYSLPDYLASHPNQRTHRLHPLAHGRLSRGTARGFGQNPLAASRHSPLTGGELNRRRRSKPLNHPINHPLARAGFVADNRRHDG